MLAKTYYILVNISYKTKQDQSNFVQRKRKFEKHDKRNIVGIKPTAHRRRGSGIGILSAQNNTGRGRTRLRQVDFH